MCGLPIFICNDNLLCNVLSDIQLQRTDKYFISCIWAFHVMRLYNLTSLWQFI